MRVSEVVCTGRFARWMRARSWAGFTAPLPFYGVVIFYWLPPNQETRTHELKHCEQVRRYGFLGFVCRYAWGHLRHGYAANPLEVEAYEACDGAESHPARDAPSQHKRAFPS